MLREMINAHNIPVEVELYTVETAQVSQLLSMMFHL